MRKCVVERGGDNPDVEPTDGLDVEALKCEATLEDFPDQLINRRRRKAVPQKEGTGFSTDQTSSDEAIANHILSPAASPHAMAMDEPLDVCSPPHRESVSDDDNGGKTGQMAAIVAAGVGKKKGMRKAQISHIGFNNSVNSNGVSHEDSYESAGEKLGVKMEDAAYKVETSASSE